MFTSDIKDGRHDAFVTARKYLVAALLCVLFSIVYEHFSHGVYSNFMVYLFLFPLLGGTLPFGLLYLFRHIPYPSPAACSFYHAGIATLGTGSCMKGVLEIYGTTSPYLLVYWIVGGCFTAAGLVLYIRSLCRPLRQRS